MSNRVLLCFSIGLALFFFSCTASRHVSVIGGKNSPADTSSAISVKDKLQDNIFKFEWMSCKAKVRIIDKNGATDITTNFRIRRDSAIWITVSSLGFEGYRLLITKDSIRALDRVNKKYLVKDFSFFSQFTSIPVNYNTLQNIITGVPVYFEEKKLKVKKEDTTYVLLSNGKRRSSTIAINSDYTLLNMDLVDSTVGKSLKLKYKNYDKGNTKPFALDREVDLGDAKDTRILIYFSKVIINQPLKLPFDSGKYDN